MNGRVVVYVLGNLLLLLGVCLLVPLAVAIFVSDPGAAAGREVYSFLLTIGICLALGVMARWFFRTEVTEVRVREGFAIVAFSWLVATSIGMLPYLISGTCHSVADAFFETMSGFTTTGATIFPRVEVVPTGVQFWRCMTQWLGGMGIVVLSVALLPTLGAGGYRLLKAESPGGVAFERERPRITDTAKELWWFYLLFSAAEVVLLSLAGMSVFDAFCHTFTTMSTGGFSPHSESIAFFSSPLTQWIVIVFMFLAGINFSLHAQWLRGRVRKMFRNPELRLYVVLLVACVAVGLVVIPRVGDGEVWLREVTFQVVSIGTTTGYVTAVFDVWPQLMRANLVCLMFVGGCMGSTGGGMKVARLLVFAKAVARETFRPFFPHAVRPIRVGSRVLENSLVSNILAFGTLYSLTFLLGTLVMAAYGYDLVTSLSASAAALGNIGPGLGRVGPTQTWAHLPTGAKWVMSFLMLAGRLEIYSVFVLFTPWAWRR